MTHTIHVLIRTCANVNIEGQGYPKGSTKEVVYSALKIKPWRYIPRGRAAPKKKGPKVYSKMYIQIMYHKQTRTCAFAAI